MVCEDSPYGTGILRPLADALHTKKACTMDSVVVPVGVSDEHLGQVLYRLKEMPATVFIVHMRLAIHFFTRAKDVGMMSKAYVWIATLGLGNVVDSLSPDEIDYFQGVVTLRPFVQATEDVKNFSARLKARFHLDNLYADNVPNSRVLQLWAYDTARATALAAEIAGLSGSATWMAETDLGRHCVPATRRAFLDSILNTTFVGLAGKFKLVNGEQQVPSYEIMNVTGEGTKGVGLWTPLYLLSQNLSTEGSSFDNSRSGTGTLNPMFWQEDTVITSKVHEKIGFTFTVDIKPSIDSETENRNTRELLGRNSWKLRGNHTKTWKLRGNHTKTLLKIAVPQKYGFKTFVNVSYPYFFCEENVTRHGTMRQKVIGYSIDIFDAAMKMLEHPPCYEFCVFSGPYDELVSNVSSGNFDGAVGDVTITAERTRQVDFTMPYTQSGVSLLVLSQNKLKPIQWTFLAPLTKELWFATVGFFVFTGFVVWMIERPRNPEYQGSSLRQFSTTLYFSFSTLTFSHDPIIRSPLSKIVVVIWCFVVLVIVQSYTASLSSKLTADMLRPSVTDLEQLLFNGDYVGYQQGSFVCSILRNRGFSENRLIPYVTSEEYAEALRKGWVSAIVDEIPYFTSFFSDPQYQEEFQMLNTIYKTPGFAFVFPLGSPLVHNLSTAVLTLTGEEGSKIEDRWLGVPRSYASSNRDFVPLTLQSFSSLFLTSGFISSLILLISIVRLVHGRWTDARNADAQSVGNSAANEESRPLQNDTGNISPDPEARNDDYQGVQGSGGHGGDEESCPVQNDTGNNSVRGQVLHEATSNDSQVACRNGGSDGHEELSAVQNGVCDGSISAQSFQIGVNNGGDVGAILRGRLWDRKGEKTSTFCRCIAMNISSIYRQRCFS